MEGSSAEGLLEARGATEVEGATAGQGEGMSGSWRRICDGEGEAATPRKNLIVPSSQPRRNLRMQFRTPQAIKTAKQVKNSQLEPDEPPEFPSIQNSHAYELSRMEAQTESTGSSPQPPLPRGRGHPSIPEMGFPKPARVGVGAYGGKEQEAGLASMAENMKQKFDKYWDNNDGLNPLLFIAVILDPRYKLKFLEFGFSNIYDQDKAKFFTKKVDDGLRRLFEWYVEAESAANNSEAPHAPLVVDLEECAEDPRKLWASNFKEHLQVIESKAANTELSRYLSELCEKDTDEFNILNWWRRQRNKYPTLSKVAKDVLVVPVSTIASEASFSTGRRVVNPQRSSLSPKMVEALICGQSWLRSSPNKIDIRQTIADLHKYEELAQELGALEFGET